jgi:hypothetical protein
VKTYAVVAISVAVTAIIGAAGFWFGQNPVSITFAKSETPAAQEQTAAPGAKSWVMETQFEGPLKDTVVQRWRDPATGVLCYIYLPVIVPHSQPLQNGMVHYDANPTGTISCVPAKA